MNKQPELTAITRGNLVAAYFDIASEGKKPTVGAVTERAGYNRCTFYRYFTDTEQLLHEVESEICGAFQEALTRYDTEFLPSEIIRSFAAVYERYGDYLSVLLGKYGDVRFTGKMKEIMYPMAARIFSPASDSDVMTELKIEFVLSAVLATVTKWYDMKQPVSVSQLGALIKDILKL